MKAIVMKPGDKAPRLVWQEVGSVSIGTGEVLVTVRATAVNRADLLQAQGQYPPPPGVSDILGLEISGVISAVAEGVDGWTVGERVLALLPGGGYAEQAAVPGGLLMRLPDGWSFAQGAAVPEAWLTAFLNLFIEGQLAAGESVLIHAGASGVGTAAIQMARAAGAEVFATAGSVDKLEACRRLGAALGFRRPVGEHRAHGRTPGRNRPGKDLGEKPAPDRVAAAPSAGFRKDRHHPSV